MPNKRNQKPFWDKHSLGKTVAQQHQQFTCCLICGVLILKSKTTNIVQGNDNLYVYRGIYDHKESQTGGPFALYMLDNMNDDDYDNIPDGELHLHWPELSGYTEFFTIEGLELND